MTKTKDYHVEQHQELPPYFKESLDRRFEDLERNITTELRAFQAVNEKSFEMLHKKLEFWSSKIMASEVIVAQLDTKVSTLELWRAEIMGKVAVVVGVVAIIVSVAVDWVKKKLQ